MAGHPSMDSQSRVTRSTHRASRQPLGRQPDLKQPFKALSRTSTMPRYYHDGNGRDAHVTAGDGGCIPRTGVCSFSAQPPRVGHANLEPRTTTMPPFQPNGSGRDMFQAPRPAKPFNFDTELRSYARTTDLSGLAQLGMFRPISPTGRPRSPVQQRKLTNRLSQPKYGASPQNGRKSTGRLTQGDFLRPASGSVQARAKTASPLMTRHAALAGQF